MALAVPETTATPAQPTPVEKPVAKAAPAPAPKVAEVAKPIEAFKMMAKLTQETEISPTPTKVAAPKSSSKAASRGEYTVQDGESILLIAKKLGVPAKSLIALNNLEDPYLLHIGDKLAVSAPAKMVAIRSAFEASGGSVSWDKEKREVRATDSQHDVVLKPGSAQAVVNSEKVKMDVPSVIQSGRTLVSGLFITETLGMGK